MRWLNIFNEKTSDSVKKTNNSRESEDNTDSVEEDREQTIMEPKYSHPKIMLVDVDSQAAVQLRGKGYNVSEASFGRPYSVRRENQLYPLFVEDKQLPHDYQEQDIIVVDLDYDSFLLKNESTPEVKNGVDTWWVSHKNGHVDPRPLIGEFLRKDFDRILNSGGIFIIFADQLKRQRFNRGSINSYGNVNKIRSVTYSSWDFLSTLSIVDIHSNRGSEVRIDDELARGSVIAQIISRHLKSTKYSCTLSPKPIYENDWIPLAVNKFDIPVSGLFLPDKSRNREGVAIVVPCVKDKSSFVTELVHEFLPTLKPDLFPELEKATWTSQPKYELPKVRKLQEQIVEIREQAELEIDEIEDEIQGKKEETSYIFDLARETGDALVSAVHESLLTLGFQKVIDSDEKMEAKGIQGQNREDLQIHDCSPVLMVEVKGISHFPSDDDALTVQKYVTLWMKEWDRTDVEGLSVINHQRHLPPLDRDNDAPFREELVTAAEQQDIGLMTGWDLHKLVRSYIQNEWKLEDVKNIFYNSGRISIIPNHYEFIGTVKRYIDDMNVVGIRLSGSLSKGDRVAYELPTVFREERCDSLEHNNQDISDASADMLVGMKTTLTKEEAETGTRVFKVAE